MMFRQELLEVVLSLALIAHLMCHTSKHNTSLTVGAYTNGSFQALFFTPHLNLSLDTTLFSKRCYFLLYVLTRQNKVKKQN